jgi:hypothetical protein
MKQIKALILALALLAPQPAHAVWYQDAWGWIVEHKNAALCAVGIATACAVYRYVYQARRSENELNMLGAREALVVSALNELKKEIEKLTVIDKQDELKKEIEKLTVTDKQDELKKEIEKPTVTYEQAFAEINKELIPYLREDRQFLNKFLAEETAKTKEEQEKNQKINEQLEKLDKEFIAIMYRTVLKPLEDLSQKNFIPESKAGETSLKIQEPSSVEKINAIESVEAINAIEKDFLTEMKKLKSPTSTQPKLEPAPRPVDTGKGKEEEEEPTTSWVARIKRLFNWRNE